MPLLALLPMLAPMLGPILGRLVGSLGGDKAEAEVASVLGALFGGTDEARVRAAMANPQQVTDTAVRLAEIAAQREAAARQADLDERRALLGDTASARQQTTALATVGSPIAWGAPIVSFVIVVGFFGSFCMLLLRGYAPDPGTAAMLNIMVGTLAAGFAAVVGYWLGSSAGSAKKDVLLAGASQQQQAPPIATTGDVVVNGSPQSSAEPVAFVRQPSPPGTTADDLNRQQLGEPPRVRVKAGSTSAMPSRFDACLPVILANEGGFVNNPADPGGATNMGITRATLAVWREHEVTEDDVRALTVEEASAIYRARYWLPNRCDQMPVGVDLAVFDFAVNSGGAIKAIQRRLGVTADGAVGPITLAAFARMSPAQAVNTITQARLTYLRSLGGWKDFGKGWSNRVEAVRSKAVAMTGE